MQRRVRIALGALVSFGMLTTVPATGQVPDGLDLPPGASIEIGREGSDVPQPPDCSTPQSRTFELTAEEIVAGIDDLRTYEFWTFGGKIPGPMLRACVGDSITVRFHNLDTNVMRHNVDFHAVTGPHGGAGLLTAFPGETMSFTFKALKAGLYVYHCADGAVGDHVARGMYGMILIEPEGGLAPVDREFYVMEGDFYSLLPADVRGRHDYDHNQALAEHPAWVVFNGRVGSLTGDRALTAAVGETVRLFVGAGGPNLASSFHVIGEIFDRAWVWGSLTSPPVLDVQTVTVPPGGALMAEFALEVPGDYKLVDHSIHRVLKGAVGILSVEGPEAPEIFRSGE